MTGVPPPPSPGRWEYWIWIPEATWSPLEESHVIEGVDGHLPSWVDVLNAVGELGWELVAVTDRPTVSLSMSSLTIPGSTMFYMKRRSAGGWRPAPAPTTRIERLAAASSAFIADADGRGLEVIDGVNCWLLPSSPITNLVALRADGWWMMVLKRMDSADRALWLLRELGEDDRSLHAEALMRGLSELRSTLGVPPID